MLKYIIIDLADWLAAFAERRSRVWLNRSKWWTNLADVIEHGHAASEGGRDE